MILSKEYNLLSPEKKIKTRKIWENIKGSVSLIIIARTLTFAFELLEESLAIHNLMN